MSAVNVIKMLDAGWKFAYICTQLQLTARPFSGSAPARRSALTATCDVMASISVLTILMRKTAVRYCYTDPEF